MKAHRKQCFVAAFAGPRFRAACSVPPHAASGNARSGVGRVNLGLPSLLLRADSRGRRIPLRRSERLRTAPLVERDV